MKLYNNNTAKNYKTIQTNDGTLYPEKLTTEQLNSYDYYVVIEDREDPLQFHTLEKSESLIDDEYVIAYTNTPITLVEAQKIMLDEIISISKQKLNEAVAKYSSAEMAAWESLEKEALAFLNGGDISLSPMIQNEAEVTGQTPVDVATKVVEKATQFKQLRTYVVGSRYKKEQEIDALTSIQECQDFYETISEW